MTLPVAEIASDHGLVVGVDLGGSRLRAAAATLDGTVLAETDDVTTLSGAAQLADQIHGAIRAVVGRPASDWSSVASVVVGVPGVPRGDVLLRAPNLPGSASGALLARLDAELDVPVLFENDANLAVVAERARGHARGRDDVGFVSIGTGIGVGAFIAGRLLRGASGGAGEIGDLPFGQRSRDGRHDTLEDAAGGAGLARRFAAESTERRSASAREIYALADAGEPRAVRLVADHAAAIAYVVATVTAVLDCGLVVLGGSIGVRDGVRARVQAHLDEISEHPPELRASRLGNRAGLLGAVDAARFRLATPRTAAAART